jgi:cobalt-zinc-cadmium resistance protein CzcA
MLSVVEDVQHLINTKLILPPGYTISYGGQFENLQSASKRLKLAVPVALILILIMLHFAFQSFKDALMVYSAIPLSAIGGVFLLWIRGLPFSISAGVGFIALFGIAVLNGIVLIEHLKELEKHGITDIRERVLLGTHQRLRPVLVTAAAAALGFLPMAISTSAGAEVQRPLATVVIGGLITSTLLTMIALPVLYCVTQNRDRNLFRFVKKSFRVFVLLLLFLGLPFISRGQSRPLQLSEAIDLAVINNHELRSYQLKVEQSSKLKGEAFNLDPANLYYGYDANNFAENSLPLKVFGIQQSLSFPGVYSAQFKAMKSRSELQRIIYSIQHQQLVKKVTIQFYTVVTLQRKLEYYEKLDSLYDLFKQAATRGNELGETNYLEALTAQSKALQIKARHMQAYEDHRIALQQLNALIQSDSTFTVPVMDLQPLTVHPQDLSANPGLLMQDELQHLAGKELSIEQNKLVPGINLEYFMGSNNGEEARKYPGYQVGLTIPLFFGAQHSRIQAAKIEKEITHSSALNYAISLKARQEELLTDIRKYNDIIMMYQTHGKIMASEIRKYARLAYENGEIDVFQYLRSLEDATDLELDYLDNLNHYNKAVLELNYLNLQ